MAESSWPTTAGSRAVLDQEHEALARAWSGSADGILGYPGDTTVAYADASGRQVKVRASKLGQVRGRGWYSGTSDNTLSVTANSSGSTRMDLLVLRLTRSTWAPTMVVKAGTPGAGNPALTQDATSGISTTGVWEIPILLITVVNGETSLSSGEVQDVAWYMQGDTVVTTSTNPYQPSATAYTRLRHSDTGHTYISVASAWQRDPWHTAWGAVGGRYYSAASTAFVTGVGGTEAITNVDTGSVALLAGRRYQLRALVVAVASTATYVILAFRDTNVSGTVRGKWEEFIQSGQNYYPLVEGRYNCAGNESKTFVVTAATLGGGTVAISRDSAFSVWVEVVDMGPTANLTSTT